MKIENSKLKIPPNVAVAMSGGVDSAVVVQLLKNRGYNVIGVFMRMHKNSNPKDARMIAKKIGIDFKILAVQKEFKKRVIDYFVNEYKKGNTPNPCVECNRWIKFRFLLKKMNELGADFVATGHYARLRREFPISNFRFPIKLLTAKDKQKDQSYFLWQLNQKQLSKILFPLGDYTKEQVKGLAKKFKLPVFNKPESQDVCFAVPRRSSDKIGTKRGDIITTNGKIVGTHKGLMFYTIGQRKGIEIGGIGPFYVVKKDFKKNVLIISKNQQDLMQKELVIKNVNWLNKPMKFPFKCGVKIRSMAKITNCSVSKLGNLKLNQNSKFKIIFSSPQRAITPGQSAVIYLGNELIGGGVIV